MVPVCDKGATIVVTEQVMGTPLPTSTYGISLSEAATEAQCDTAGADVVGNAPVTAGGSVTFNVVPGVHYCLRESSYDGALSDVTTPHFVLPTAGTPHLTATNVSEFRGAKLAPTLAWVKDGTTLPGLPPGLDTSTFQLRADVTDHDGKLLYPRTCDYGLAGLDCENLGLPLGSTVHFSLDGAPAGWSLTTDVTGADCAGIPDMGTCAPALAAHLDTPGHHLARGEAHRGRGADGEGPADRPQRPGHQPAPHGCQHRVARLAGRPDPAARWRLPGAPALAHGPGGPHAPGHPRLDPHPPPHHPPP